MYYFSIFALHIQLRNVVYCTIEQPFEENAMSDQTKSQNEQKATAGQPKPQMPDPWRTKLELAEYLRDHWASGNVTPMTEIARLIEVITS